MTRICVSAEEWYPVPEVYTEPAAAHGRRVKDIPDDIITRFIAARDAFTQASDALWDAWDSQP